MLYDRVFSSYCRDVPLALGRRNRTDPTVSHESTSMPTCIRRISRRPWPGGVRDPMIPAEPVSLLRARGSAGRETTPASFAPQCEVECARSALGTCSLVFCKRLRLLADGDPGEATRVLFRRRGTVACCADDYQKHRLSKLKRNPRTRRVTYSGVGRRHAVGHASERDHVG